MIIKRSPVGPTESAELSFTPAKRTAKAQRIPFACIEETPSFDSSPPHGCPHPGCMAVYRSWQKLRVNTLRRVCRPPPHRGHDAAPGFPWHSWLGTGGCAADAAPPPSTFCRPADSGFRTPAACMFFNQSPLGKIFGTHVPFTSLV